MSLSLTEKGEREYEKVIEIVYMMINKLLKEIDMPEYIFDEYREKRKIDYDNITKTSALKYANMLGRRMRYMQNEDDADDILWAPYDLNHFDKADIRARLEMLRPENMYAIYHS